MDTLLRILGELDPDTKLVDPSNGEEWDAFNILLVLRGMDDEEIKHAGFYSEYVKDGIGIWPIKDDGFRHSTAYLEFATN